MHSHKGIRHIRNAFCFYSYHYVYLSTHAKYIFESVNGQPPTMTSHQTPLMEIPLMDVKSSDRFGTIRITGNDLACGQVIRHTLQLFRKL